ncbi:MAG: hypothetical protein ACE5JV_01460 [Nitrososphaerales archaeon]
MDLEKFTRDVNRVASKGYVIDDGVVLERVNFVKQRLIDLYKRNLVKINHSVMEIVCAKHLIRYGYDVDVERQLSDTLICDVYATKGDGSFIVEIETGFTPPEHALDPLGYYISRIASKVSRYSQFASKFALATPPSSLLPIPEIFMKPPRHRKAEEIMRVKELCDRYYKNPPIGPSEIQNARLHSIYVINVDGAYVKELDPESYQELIQDMNEKTGLQI